MASHYFSAALAHLVEQLICNHQVAGSSPASGTIFFFIAGLCQKFFS